jgi:mRNA interferase MazF
VYWLDFAPATGREMTGVHPCVVIQNDVGNRYSALTIVVAVTSNLRVASLPVGELLKAGDGGLAHDSAVHCGHVYTVDKHRLGKRLGQLTAAQMALVDKALACSVGLGPP